MTDSTSVATTAATHTATVTTAVHIHIHREAKLVLGKVIPHTTEHFLYLDADVLVRSDICQLWSQRTHGLAAVIDYGFPGGHSGLSSALVTSILAEQQWDPLQDRYFNAGLLLAETSVYAAAGDAILAALHSGTWRFGDQVSRNTTTTPILHSLLILLVSVNTVKCTLVVLMLNSHAAITACWHKSPIRCVTHLLVATAYLALACLIQQIHQ
jgi:Glycosyl transferase family 8